MPSTLNWTVDSDVFTANVGADPDGGFGRFLVIPAWSYPPMVSAIKGDYDAQENFAEVEDDLLAALPTAIDPQQTVFLTEEGGHTDEGVATWHWRVVDGATGEMYFEREQDVRAE